MFFISEQICQPSSLQVFNPKRIFLLGYAFSFGISTALFVNFIKLYTMFANNYIVFFIGNHKGTEGGLFSYIVSNDYLENKTVGEISSFCANERSL